MQAAAAVTLVAVAAAVVGVAVVGVAGCAEIAGPLKVAYIIYLQSHAKKPKRDLVVVVVVAGQAQLPQMGVVGGASEMREGAEGAEGEGKGKLKLQLELQLKLKLLLVLANSAICNWPGQLNLIRSYLSRAIVCAEGSLPPPFHCLRCLSLSLGAYIRIASAQLTARQSAKHFINNNNNNNNRHN